MLWQCRPQSWYLQLLPQLVAHGLGQQQLLCEAAGTSQAPQQLRHVQEEEPLSGEGLLPGQGLDD
jgi:hypothetical protein